MEERVKQYAKTLKGNKYKNKRALSLIRYADDFVVLHEELTVVQRCQIIISESLKDMGLELKPSKTRLTHTLNKCENEEPGFNFLGFHIRQFRVGKYHSKQCFKTIITPSKEKQKIHYERIASIINDHKAAPQEALISRLNPVIRGWSNYYSTVVSKETYSKLDNLVYSKLKAWAQRRHPNKSGEWVAKKYWRTIGDDNWNFATNDNGKFPCCLLKHSETPIVRHVKVKGETSPFDGNLVYWSSRMGAHPEMPKRVTKLLKQQKGKCAHCGLYFREDDMLEIDHKIPRNKGGKDEYKNLQILHRHCHDTKTAKDILVGGMHLDKHQIAEEPDEVKVSRPVLKTSRSGDRTT